MNGPVPSGTLHMHFHAQNLVGYHLVILGFKQVLGGPFVVYIHTFMEPALV